jgi:hypothetical protein
MPSKPKPKPKRKNATKRLAKKVRVVHAKRRSKANPKQKQETQNMAVPRVHQKESTVMDQAAPFTERQYPTWLTLSPSNIPKCWSKFPVRTISMEM